MRSIKTLKKSWSVYYGTVVRISQNSIKTSVSALTLIAHNCEEKWMQFGSICCNYFIVPKLSENVVAKHARFPTPNFIFLLCRISLCCSLFKNEITALKCDYPDIIVSITVINKQICWCKPDHSIAAKS